MVFLVSGCSTPPFAFKKNSVLPANESVVFGRIAVTTRGNPVIWHGGAFAKEGRFSICLWKEGEKECEMYELMKDGVFVWHLTPGDYIVAGYEWRHGSFVTGARIWAKFTVPEHASAVYLGTLRMPFGGGTERTTVVDEFDVAVQALRAEFPEINLEPSRQLMQLSTEGPQ